MNNPNNPFSLHNIRLGLETLLTINYKDQIVTTKLERVLFLFNYVWQNKWKYIGPELRYIWNK